MERVGFRDVPADTAYGWEFDTHGFYPSRGGEHLFGRALLD